MGDQAAPAHPPPQAIAQAPQPVAPGPSTSTTTSPAVLSNPELKLQFGRFNSTRRRVNVTVQPGQLDRVFRSEFLAAENTLGRLMAAPLSTILTIDQYIQMSRTLVLKRLMDIQECQSGVRHNPIIQMSRGLDVPRCTADLLYALGPYFCEVIGRQYHLTYAAPPAANPPAWYALGVNILAQYRRFVDMLRNRTELAPFPKISEMNGQPLMFTAANTANNLRQVRASINVPTPADAFLRLVHEDTLFGDNSPVFNYGDLVMTEGLFVDDVVNRYTRSYTKSVFG